VHCASPVHQQGTPEASHVPVGDVTSSQLPLEQAYPVVPEVASWHPVLSAMPLPVQAPVQWFAVLTHFRVEQFESATQRQEEWVGSLTGAGDSVVGQP
jgi:hypothetical protein